MPRVYAAWKRRCWGVQPDDMCQNCAYFFFDNLPAVPGYWSPLGADAMQRNHKWLHDQLSCDVKRVDVVGELVPTTKARYSCSIHVLVTNVAKKNERKRRKYMYLLEPFSITIYSL